MQGDAMGLYELPAELLECIFEHIFPARWGSTDPKTTWKYLGLRLTCKKFDRMICYCALGKYELIYEKTEERLAWTASDTIGDMNQKLAVRLLAEKVRREGESHNSLIVAIQQVGRLVFPLTDYDHEDQVWYRLCTAAVSHMLPAQVALHLLLKDNRPLGCKTYDHALSAAAYEGDLSLLKRLIENGADVNGRSQIFGIPLHLAASGNHQEAFALVLENGARMTEMNGEHTVLHEAILNHQKEMTQLLLDRHDVELKLDMMDRTPLETGVWVGDEAIVKLLLERDVGLHRDATTLDSALFTAILLENDEITRLLIEKINSRPDSERKKSLETALLSAADNGNHRVAKLLLDRESISPNVKTESGKSALMLAADNPFADEVVKLLLERDDMDPNAKSSQHETALTMAVLRGNKIAVKLLLARKDIDRNLKGVNDESPLALAVERGQVYITELLLGWEDVEVNHNGSGGTPLHTAAYRGRVPVVRLLLGNERIDANAKDNFGETPLSFAVSKGHENVVKLLLERRDIKVNSKNIIGETPLLLAAESGNVEIARLLLKRHDVNGGSQSFGIGAPLISAVGRGHVEIVRLLLEREEVEVNRKDEYGRSALLLAAAAGRETIAKLLLERKDIHPYSVDIFGCSPMDAAIAGGRSSIVKFLQPWW